MELFPRKGILSNPSSRVGRLNLLPPLSGIPEIPLLLTDGMTDLSPRGALKNPSLRGGGVLILLPLLEMPPPPTRLVSIPMVLLSLEGMPIVALLLTDGVADMPFLTLLLSKPLLTVGLIAPFTLTGCLRGSRMIARSLTGTLIGMSPLI